jgi:hypothetical protein
LIAATQESLWILHNETSINANQAEAEFLVARTDRIFHWLSLFDKKKRYEIRSGSEFHFGSAATKALAQAARSNLSRIIDPWFAAGFVKGCPSDLAGDGSVESIKFDFERGRGFVENLVANNPEKYLVVVLECVRRTLSETAAIMKTKTPRGGPKPHAVGPWMLSNLAEVYVHFVPAGKPSTDPNGPFASFARDVVDAMGLPSGWIDRQIRSAVRDWRLRKAGQNPAKKS